MSKDWEQLPLFEPPMKDLKYRPPREHGRFCTRCREYHTRRDPFGRITEMCGECVNTVGQRRLQEMGSGGDAD